MTKILKFGVIGGLGFGVDSISFFWLLDICPTPMIARLTAFWLAASATWFGNRCFTFAMRRRENLVSQWCKYMVMAHGTGALNLLVFYWLRSVTTVPIAFCGGIAIGTFANYFFLNKFVFARA